ncbi:unnamed protein product, partial [Iphiclides podalirius]
MTKDQLDLHLNASYNVSEWEQMSSAGTNEKYSRQLDCDDDAEDAGSSWVEMSDNFLPEVPAASEDTLLQNITPKHSISLSWWRGLRVLMTSKAMPDRVSHTGQAWSEGPDEEQHKEGPSVCFSHQQRTHRIGPKRTGLRAD